MANDEKILAFISQKGPVIPAQISKELGINQLFSSAMLAELVERGKLHLSHLKIGGTPLYFLPGQEDKLQEYYIKLPEKEQRVYLYLKEKKILVDSELEPLQRVALRQIKDFAKPLQITQGNADEIFWKWYLTTDKEAEQIIRQILNPPASIPSSSVTKVQTEEKVQEEIKPLSSKSTEKEESIAPIIEEKESKVKKPKKEKADASQFHALIASYFEKNKIKVIETTIIKKNSEFDYLLLLPTPVGELKYYCKAKNKQKCNDADISAAYVQGQLKKLPVLMLTPGDFTKRAKDMLANELKGMTVALLS